MAAARRGAALGTLVHEDIIDKADMPRQTPRIIALGANCALLSGDYLFSKAGSLSPY
jgi:geranylgeranyl pyrophosphate synthase